MLEKCLTLIIDLIRFKLELKQIVSTHQYFIQLTREFGDIMTQISIASFGIKNTIFYTFVGFAKVVVYCGVARVWTFGG